MKLQKPKILFVLIAWLLVAWLSHTIFAVEVHSYKDLRGVKFRQYDLQMTIDSFDCEATVGKKCTMTLTVENRGERPDTFDATQLSIDNAKGTTYRAKPVGTSPAKEEIKPGGRAEFRVFFDGRIFFDKRAPAHLKYTNDTKVDIIK